MKKYCAVFMLIALALFASAGCSKGDGEDEIPLSEETYVVSLALAGDIDIFYEPLTRSIPTNDIYGINVYYDKNKDGNINTVYAYGLFDNVEDMTIPLLSGYKYKFECSLVKDGKNKLYSGQAFGQSYTGYCYPFQTGASTPTILGNKFVLGTTKLTGLQSGNAHLKGTTPTTSNYVKMPSIARYYGETMDYIPTKNGKVTIALKRTVFGARFIIKGIQEDGALSASCGDLWSKTSSQDDEGVEMMYSYSDVYDCWKNESHQTYTVKASYTTTRGEKWDWDKNVTFKRNVMTTVTINVNVDHYLLYGSIGFSEEPLNGENYIDLGINGDGIIDTPVEPAN